MATSASPLGVLLLLMLGLAGCSGSSNSASQPVDRTGGDLGFTASEAAADVVPGPLPVGFTVAGDPVEPTGGEDVAPESVIVTLPGERPPAGALPAVVHRISDDYWEIEAADHTEDGYTVEASTLSPRVPGWLDVDQWLDDPAVALTVDRPVDDRCPSSPPAWVTIEAAAGNEPFTACLRPVAPGADGRERVEVELRSARPVAMWITLVDQPIEELMIEGLPDWDATVRPLVEFDDPDGAYRIPLPPLRRLRLTYGRPLEPGRQLQFSAHGSTATDILTSTYRLLGEAAVPHVVDALTNCPAPTDARPRSTVEVAVCLLDGLDQDGRPEGLRRFARTVTPARLAARFEAVAEDAGLASGAGTGPVFNLVADPSADVASGDAPDVDAADGPDPGPDDGATPPDDRADGDAEPNLRFDIGDIDQVVFDGGTQRIRFDRYQLLGSGQSGTDLTQEANFAGATDLNYDNTNDRLREYPLASDVELLEIDPERFAVYCAELDLPIEFVPTSIDRLLGNVVSLTFNERGEVIRIRDSTPC